MSNLKHTPGPWHDGTNVFGDGGIFSQDGKAICVTTRHATTDSRLIAAAPEMLDALIACYKHIKNDMHICGIVTGAKEAIERATGLSIEEVLS